MMGAHSEHFSNKELACRCCSVNNCTQTLVDALEAIRALVGKPVIVDCAYRCAKHNAQVGGVKSSMHLKGKAADIRVNGWNAVAVENIVRQVPAVHGIGRDDHKEYVHVDVRERVGEDSAVAQWCYNERGKQMEYYEA